MEEIIYRMARKYNIDPNLLYATIMTESAGNRYAYRYEPRLGEASYGYGQLLESTARSLGFKGNVKQLYDPETNIELIAKYIAEAIRRGARTPQSVATFYNTGSLRGIPTTGHVQRFMDYYNQFKPDINKMLTTARGFTSRIVPTVHAQETQYTPAPNITPMPRTTTPSYTVRSGDTLSAISKRLLGNPNRYRELTGYRSGNPNLIFPGEVISVRR